MQGSPVHTFATPFVPLSNIVSRVFGDFSLTKLPHLRGYHSSTAVEKGRNDSKNALVPKSGYWITGQSKKAKKRFKRQQEALAAKAPKTVPGNPASLQRALDVLRTDRTQSQREYQFVMDNLRMQREPSPSPRQVLKATNVDEMRAMLARGDADNDIRNYNFVMRGLGAQGRWEDVISTLNDMRNAGHSPDVKTYNALLSACAEQRNPVAAGEVIATMKQRHLAPTEVTFGAWMQSHIRAGDFPGAYSVLAAAEDSGIKLGPVLFTQLIVGLNDKGLFEKSWEVFDYMRINHCEPDVVTFTALINACGRCDQVEKALNLFTEMKQLALTPTHVTFNTLLHATGRSFRHYSRAFELFEEMNAAGFAHDVYSYNSVLLACSHKGEVGRAREFMRQMTIEGIRPDQVTFNTLITVYARALEQLKKSTHKQLSVAEQTAQLSDGKGLLDPKKPYQQQEFGSGVVYVDGDEDTVVENLLRDYEHRVGGTKLSPDQEELMSTDVTSQDIVQKGLELFEKMKSDHTNAGPRPGTKWLRSQLDASSKRVAGTLSDSDDNELLRPQREGTETVEDLRTQAAAQMPPPSRLSDLSEPEDEYEAEALAELRQLRDRLRSGPNGFTPVYDERVEAEKLLRELTGELQARVNGTVDVPSSELSGQRRESMEPVEQKMRDDVDQQRRALVGMLNDADETMQRRSQRTPSKTKDIDAFDGLALLRTLEDTEQRFGELQAIEEVPYKQDIAKVVVDSMKAEKFFDPVANTDIEFSDEDRLVADMDERLAQRLDPIAKEIMGSDLSDPDFGDDMFDIVDKTASSSTEQRYLPGGGSSQAQVDPQQIDSMLSQARDWAPQHTGTVKKSLHARMAALGEVDSRGELDGGVTGVQVDVKSGDVAEPGQLVEGFVRRKRYNRSGLTEFDDAGDTAAEATAFDAKLPSVYLGSDTLPPHVHLEHALSDADASFTSTGSRGGRRAAAGRHVTPTTSSIEDASSLSARAREIGDLIDTTPASVDETVPTVPPDATPRGSVSIDLPAHLHPDVFQERLVAAGESVAGKRKRLLMGTEPSLLNTLLTVKTVADSGALPVPATANNLTESNSAWLRLAALQSLSHTVFTGAHWVPSKYPTKHGDLRRVLLKEVSEVYEQAQHSGFTPDIVTLNAMVCALTAANAATKAHVFLASEFPRFGLAPTERTYRAFVRMMTDKSHTSRGKIDAALDLVHSMEKQGIQPTHDTFGPIVHALVRDDRLDAAFAVLDEMKSKDLVCPEVYLKLLRERCKFMGIRHDAVPKHPLAWQFTPQVKLKRKARGKRVIKTSQQLREITG